MTSCFTEIKSLTLKTEITIPIHGMSCQKCVAKVTAALQEVAGVTGVDVSLQEKLGKVKVTESEPSRDQLLATIVQAGFQTVAPVEEDETETLQSSTEDNSPSIGASGTSTFVVYGMTCANCAQTIE